MKSKAKKKLSPTPRVRNIRSPSRKRRRIDERMLNTRIRSTKINRLHFFRRFRVGLRVLAILLVLAGVVVGGRILIIKAFYENPQFALSDLRVTTDGVLTEARILREADVREGVNLLGVDIERIHSELTKLAQVDSVKIERQLPDRLVIQVHERHPIAWLSCPTLGIRAGTTSGGYLLDARGTVIDCEVMLDDYLRLPVIRARSLSRIRPGRVIESEQVLTALQILGKTGKAFGEDEMEIVLIELPTDYSIETLFSDGARITFGTEDIDRQIADLRAITDRFAETDRRIQTLDLMPTKNIPVTFTEASADRPIRRPLPKRVVSVAHAKDNVRNNPLIKREMAAREKSDLETDLAQPPLVQAGTPAGPGAPGGAATRSPEAAPAEESPLTGELPNRARPVSTKNAKEHKIERDIQAILREG